MMNIIAITLFSSYKNINIILLKVNSMLNLLRIFLIFFIILPVFGNINNLYAKEIKQYEWLYEQRDIKSEMGESPVIIELFSSQACVFCPNADNFFKDLITKTGIYGVSCHVDYYGKTIDSLSKPFCTSRQKEYMKITGSGIYYTPQMIINGTRNVVGYEYDNVLNSVIEASKSNVSRININKNENGDFYFKIKERKLSEEQDISIILMLYSKAIDMNIKQGRNKGKQISYINMIEKMEEIGKWDGSASIFTFSVKTIKSDAGFIIMAQDNNTGSVLALGEYILSNQ